MLEAITLIGFGLFFGVQHALEPDHIAGVLSVRAADESPGSAWKRGIVWGLGHSMTVLFLGGVVVFGGIHIPVQFSAFIEILIGVLLIFFGFRMIWAHLKNSATAIAHDHPPFGFHTHRAPTFWFGVLHGLAGTGAITLLVISLVHSAYLALAYLLFFCAGSTLGMGMINMALSIGLAKKARNAAVLVGGFSCISGLWILYMA